MKHDEEFYRKVSLQRIAHLLRDHGSDGEIVFTSEMEKTDYFYGLAVVVLALLERRCVECGEPVDMKPGDEITPELGRLAEDYGFVETCRSCLSKWWSEAKAKDFERDPDFGAGIQSPIQREDL